LGDQSIPEMYNPWGTKRNVFQAENWTPGVGGTKILPLGIVVIWLTGMPLHYGLEPANAARPTIRGIRCTRSSKHRQKKRRGSTPPVSKSKPVAAGRRLEIPS